jgi:hypothetical protein
MPKSKPAPAEPASAAPAQATVPSEYLFSTVASRFNWPGFLLDRCGSWRNAFVLRNVAKHALPICGERREVADAEVISYVQVPVVHL